MTVANPAAANFGQILIPGRWYSPEGIQNTNTASEASLRLAPFLVGRAGGIDRMAVQVTTAGTVGALIRLGMYRDSGDHYPGDLLVDAGTVDGTVVAIPELVVAELLTPGLYWVGGANQGAPATPAATRSLNHGATGYTAMPSPGNTGVGSNAIWAVELAGVTGALPAEFPPGEGMVNTATPRVQMRGSV